ncbi:MAG: hypothetical protein C3F07_14080 [Anaerolineales bacterium]|nr:hypothetical protein [Anaerolineae bacterium]PWB71442.1 MAG: hypothetical protein C3F07_14080 [Anaerolineales bacterium]
MRKESLIGLAILTIAGIIYSIFIYFSSVGKAPFSGHPRSMPPVVDETMDELLRSLEIEIERHFPEVIQSLEPGITAEELEKAEAALGQTIHPEMQALYRWHNGLANGEELFPGHSFWSLENAIRTNQELAVQYRE